MEFMEIGTMYSFEKQILDKTYLVTLGIERNIKQATYFAIYSLKEIKPGVLQKSYENHPCKPCNTIEEAKNYIYEKNAELDAAVTELNISHSKVQSILKKIER